jgi:peroxiredoxin
MKGGKVDYPLLVQLVAGDTRKRLPFYLENSVMTINGTMDSLFKAEVTGSKTQDEYKTFVDSNKVYTDRYANLYSQYQAATQSGDTMKMSALEKEDDAIQKDMIRLQKNFVAQHPSSYVSPSLLKSLSYEMEADELETMLNNFDSTIASLPEVKDLKVRVGLMKSVAVGQKAPDFTMNDVNGNPVTLSSRLGSGLLLIDFWAGWCGPCRQENPNVVKAFKAFNKKGFNILGVSLDHNKEAWVKAIADDNLAWTHVSDLQHWNNAAAKLYAVYAIPANFLLDEKGIIIAKNIRGEDLYNKVNEILGRK